MIASYIEVNVLFIKDLKVKSALDIKEMFESLYADKTLEEYHLDKMWDSFHYFLTGISVFDMIENNEMKKSLLSEAIVGSDGRGDESISWIYPERVKEIADVLELVDVKEKLNTFSMGDFEEKDIYMMSHVDVPEEDLRLKMLDTFEDLKSFFVMLQTGGTAQLL